MSAAFALQKAVLAALADDDALAALVGDRIHDAPPRAQEFPYVAFGDAGERDWSTGSEAGTEHRLTLLAWSRHRGKREALVIAERIAAVLHDAALTLDGHRLINLRREEVSVRGEADGLTWRGAVRFRAVTEPL